MHLAGFGLLHVELAVAFYRTHGDYYAITHDFTGFHGTLTDFMGILSHVIHVTKSKTCVCVWASYRTTYQPLF